MSKIQAVLLAAGKGSRISHWTMYVPKPLIRIDGKPLLEHNILRCKKAGITDLFINLHSHAEKIKNYFGDGSKWGVRIRYKFEKQLIGTSGAVRNFRSSLGPGTFFVLYGDNLIPYDLKSVARFHREKKADMTICIFKKKDVRLSGIADMDAGGRIIQFIEKPDWPADRTGWVNAGVYLMNKNLVRRIPHGFSDFGKDIIPDLLKTSARVFAMKMANPVKAIDTPKLLAKWKARKERAIFLDRDGILNRSVVRQGKPYPPSSASAMTSIPGVAEKLKALHEKGFLLIVVTNQPDVGRGKQTKAAVERINAVLRKKLFIDDFRICYADKDPYYKKPGPGMILEAAKEWGVDLKKSFMVGDRWADIEAGKKAGCTSLFVDYGYREPRPRRPDQTFTSSPRALKWILNQNEKHRKP